MPQPPDHKAVYCEARTWAQARGGSFWGCQRGAVMEVEGHWACRQHIDHPPKNGWN